LFYPGDYAKNYGRKYGIGLGPDPVSECLDSEYDTAPPAITPEIRRIEQIMFPVRNSKAQLDLMLVSPEEYAANRAILAIDDPRMEARATLVRAKQLKNPAGGPLVALTTEWNRIQGRI